VIGDSVPAAITVPPQRGPTGVVRALTAMRAHGDRDTAAALGLAVRQFPAAPAGRRVALLYTTAPDAGGESATALAARLRATGTILVVVATATGAAYWSDAAAGTGGFLAPAGDPVVIPALDQVTTTLRGRYLVGFPTPPVLPARVSVRIETGDLQLTGEVTVAAPAPSAAPRTADGSPVRPLVLLAVSVTVLAAVLVLVAVVRGRRPRRARPKPSTMETPDPPAKWVVRGRASVPPASRLPPEI
jgi:hypothetical protein